MMIWNCLSSPSMYSKRSMRNKLTKLKSYTEVTVSPYPSLAVLKKSIIAMSESIWQIISMISIFLASTMYEQPKTIMFIIRSHRK